jgi:enoyl-CoA hydratase/carnithine racemase
MAPRRSTCACHRRYQLNAAISTCACHRRYQLNAAIAASPKPQVSIWDGFCMGGGAGISVHGAFRVATKKTLFAM